MYLEQLKSGRWRVAVKLNGVRKSEVHDTKAEARIAGNKMELAVADTGPRARSVVTFGALLDEQLETYPLPSRHNRQCIINTLPDEPRAWLIRDIDTATLRRLMYSLEHTHGWKADKRRTFKGLMSAAFARAVNNGWLHTNPCKDLAAVDTGTPVLDVPTDDEVAAVLQACHNDTFRLFVRCAALFGTRRGETVGLQWSDIDFETSTLRIRRSISNRGNIVTEGSAGKKNHNRKLSIDPDTLAALQAHRKTQVAMALAAGTPSPVWMWSDDAGVTPWNAARPGREFRTAADLAGVTTCLKNLRHYMATTWLLAGVPPLVVAQRLGHDVQTLLRTYAQYIPEPDNDNAARFAQRLAG